MIDTRYNIELDLVRKKINPDMFFNLSDNETSDFYIKITNDNKDIDISNYQVVLYVAKPNKNTKDTILQYDSEKGCIYCNLESDFKNIIGIYVAQIAVKDNSTGEIKFTRGRFKYKVDSDILSERNETVVEENADILEDILDRLLGLESTPNARGVEF